MLMTMKFGVAGAAGAGFFAVHLLCVCAGVGSARRRQER